MTNFEETLIFIQFWRDENSKKNFFEQLKSRLNSEHFLQVVQSFIACCVLVKKKYKSYDIRGCIKKIKNHSKNSRFEIIGFF